MYEIKTIKVMIGIYCTGTHHTVGGLCHFCEELFVYSLRKLKNCKFKIHHLVCSECKVHCFQKEKRDSIRQVMNYSGRKMFSRHPFLSLLFLKSKLKSKIIKQTIFRQK